MIKRLTLILLVLSIAGGVIFSQEISEKKELAVFKLSYWDYDIPQSAIGSIDEEIKSVFINLGRFNVIGMTYRLGQDDVNAFIGKIKEYKQQNVKIPEKFQMGREIFTERDMNQLIGSFYVVIPAVTFFSVEKDKSGDYSAEVKVSVSVIDVEKANTFAQFFVETDGTSGDSGERAAQRAIAKIPVMLEYEVTKIPEFTLKTAVLETRGGEVLIALGQNMGIRMGYEFMVLSPKVLGSGRTFASETGLVLIKEVGEEASLATVLYGFPKEGDQLKEVPRIGFETTPYFDVLINPFDEFGVNFVAGIRASWTKGLYGFRPIVGFEFPLPIGTTDTLLPYLWIAGFPFNVYLGGEATFYVRRLQITPQVGVGAGFLVPWWVKLEDKFIVTHIGGFANMNLSYLITRDIKLSIDLGYKHWIGIWDVLLEYVTDKTTSYGGFMVGGGVTFKL
ncbi:MAG TPA: hypothetical protein VMX75_08480 [Spirochaetia bacterium]|nr:hypothetical protein [Spirochaetia bacterium]